MARQAQQKQRQAFNKLEREVRALDRKQKQAVDKQNREARAYNQKQQRALDKHNRDVRAHNQAVTQAVNRRNNEVRAYNNRVRANRQRLKNEIARLNQKSKSSEYAAYRISVNAVLSSYEHLESAAETDRFDERYNEILDLSEREAANNAGLMNVLLGDGSASEDAAALNNSESPLKPILQKISEDLSDRWQGALFALSPDNPDSARHFCTSAREIITGILDSKAPNTLVEKSMPDCERTQQGTPTRRAKISYLLHQQKLYQSELESFVESDLDNVIQLFHTFNEGTHGVAGKFDYSKLQMIRKRVEDGIMFLSRIIQ